MMTDEQFVALLAYTMFRDYMASGVQSTRYPRGGEDFIEPARRVLRASKEANK